MPRRSNELMVTIFAGLDSSTPQLLAPENRPLAVADSAALPIGQLAAHFVPSSKALTHSFAVPNGGLINVEHATNA